MLFRDVPSLLIIFVLTMPQPLRKGAFPVLSPRASGRGLRGVGEGRRAESSKKSQGAPSLLLPHTDTLRYQPLITTERLEETPRTLFSRLPL